MGRTKKRQLAASYTVHNKVNLVRGGASYFELLLDLIASAQDFIHLQTYIYSDDHTGRLVADGLISAAGRGVAVYLLADGYASRKMSPAFVAMLKEGGVHFRFFEPLFRSNHFYFGRRLHHKLLVIDAATAVVGGINIGDHYNDRPGQPGWLDFAIKVEGEIARDLCILCCKTWKGFGTGHYITPCANSRVLSMMNTYDPTMIRMRRNDWVNNKNQISKTYIEMLVNARSNVIILCSYFLPGTIIRNSIIKAIERGVKVTVIVAGKSDLLSRKMPNDSCTIGCFGIKSTFLNTSVISYMANWPYVTENGLHSVLITSTTLVPMPVLN